MAIKKKKQAAMKEFNFNVGDEVLVAASELEDLAKSFSYSQKGVFFDGGNQINLVLILGELQNEQIDN